MLTLSVTARNADEDLVKNSQWYQAMRDERDAYMGSMYTSNPRAACVVWVSSERLLV